MQKNSATAAPSHLEYPWVFIASLLLSVWLIWLDPVINRDAIIYLRAADAYLLDGFSASQQIYARPTLSILMAILHQLTGLPLLYAGLAIITFFYAVLSVSFVATVHTLGGDRTVQLLAALVVLSHPFINHNRSAIMREPAYMALMILSLREMLLYARTPRLKYQLRWMVYVILATVFRFEGLFFLTLTPLALLFTGDVEHRFRRCLQLLLPQLLVVVLLAVGLLAYQAQQPGEPPLFPAISLYLERLLAFPAEFAGLAQQAADPMLAFTARDDAPIAVLAALAAILVLNLCRAMTWPWVMTLILGARAGLQHRYRPDDMVILRTHLLITLTYLGLFVLTNRFMLERYANQFVIFGLLFVPFILSIMWHAGGWKKYLALALLLGMTADTLHNGEREKLFIAEATEWVVAQTDDDASLVANEKYIAYFSKREFDWLALQKVRFSLEKILSTPKLWHNRDYLVMYVRPREESLWRSFLADNGLEELRSFDGGRKGRVAIVDPTLPSGMHPEAQ